MDVHTAPKLTAALDAAMRESRGAFVVDLCDVGFTQRLVEGPFLEHMLAILLLPGIDRLHGRYEVTTGCADRPQLVGKV